MNWEAIGAIGDAVGGVGVVASLVYLALQTRQNTRAVRSASFHQVADSFSAVSLAVFQDPSLVSLLTRARSDSESFTPEDTARYSFFLLTLFRRAEGMFLQSEQGTLQRESWHGIHITLENTLGSPSGHRWWSEAAQRFDPAFRAYVEVEVLGNRESPE